MLKKLLLLLLAFTLINCATNHNIGIVSPEGLNHASYGTFNGSPFDLFDNNSTLSCQNIEHDLYASNNQDVCTNRINLYYLYLCISGHAAYRSYKYFPSYYIDPKGSHYKMQYFSNITEAYNYVSNIETSQTQEETLKYENALNAYNRSKAIAYDKYQKESIEYQKKYKKQLQEYQIYQAKLDKLETFLHKECLRGEIVDSSTGRPYVSLACPAVAKVLLVTDMLPRINLKRVDKPEPYMEFEYPSAPPPPKNYNSLSQDNFMLKVINDETCENVRNYPWGKYAG